MLKILVMVIVAVMTMAPATAAASIGVGVGTGRIKIDEKVKAGKAYKLPAIAVYNTGTETATYTVEVTLNETQPQIKPDPSWVSFSPKTFSLSPQKSQVVTPTLRLPVRAAPGEYFAYLEAHPAQTAQQGSTAVGVAAAAKLSFTVGASNIFVSLWYWFLSFLQRFAPWSYILITLLIIVPLYRFVRKKFNFSIRINKV